MSREPFAIRASIFLSSVFLSNCRRRCGWCKMGARRAAIIKPAYEAAMKTTWRILALLCFAGPIAATLADEKEAALPKATIDGTGPGWVELGDKDFTNNNCDDDTWRWQEGVLHSTGKPVGVIRS